MYKNNQMSFTMKHDHDDDDDDDDYLGYALCIYSFPW